MLRRACGSARHGFPPRPERVCGARGFWPTAPISVVLLADYKSADTTLALSHNNYSEESGLATGQGGERARGGRRAGDDLDGEGFEIGARLGEVGIELEEVQNLLPNLGALSGNKAVE
jgi:hypothetical protein